MQLFKADVEEITDAKRQDGRGIRTHPLYHVQGSTTIIMCTVPKKIQNNLNAIVPFSYDHSHLPRFVLALVTVEEHIVMEPGLGFIWNIVALIMN